jgi:uncharacterized membrane protein YphA (DoxX/SURF4 family)
VLARLAATYDRLDQRITQVLADMGITVLRVALGVVFLWFGLLKLIPGLSPAEGLAGKTIETLTLGIVPPSVSLPLLGVVESLIGIGLLTGWFLRAVLLVLAIQMLGTLTPLVLFPDEAFVRFPFVPTLEGQYIIKNLVLIAAAMVIGATVRGGRLVAEPQATRGSAAPEASSGT